MAPGLGSHTSGPDVFLVVKGVAISEVKQDMVKVCEGRWQNLVELGAIRDSGGLAENYISYIWDLLHSIPGILSDPGAVSEVGNPVLNWKELRPLTCSVSERVPVQPLPSTYLFITGALRLEAIAVAGFVVATWCRSEGSGFASSFSAGSWKPVLVLGRAGPPPPGARCTAPACGPGGGQGS